MNENISSLIDKFVSTKSVNLKKSYLRGVPGKGL